MRKTIAVAPSALLLWMLLVAVGPHNAAGGRIYYDAKGNVISEDAYKSMIQHRRKCLDTNSDHYEFTRCMDAFSPESETSVVEPSAVHGETPHHAQAASEPVDPSETTAQKVMEPPEITGQAEQPVRIIEREISVPGGGVLQVKEYQYE